MSNVQFESSSTQSFMEEVIVSVEGFERSRKHVQRFLTHRQTVFAIRRIDMHPEALGFSTDRFCRNFFVFPYRQERYPDGFQPETTNRHCSGVSVFAAFNRKRSGAHDFRFLRITARQTFFDATHNIHITQITLAQSPKRVSKYL